MDDRFSRSYLLLGEENLSKIKNKKVAIFGIGGVGSFVAEALVRTGIENFLLVDNDKISITNINRQIHCLESTIGLFKVDEMKKRILEINPNANVEISKEFYLPGSNLLEISKLDYIVDAIDIVTAKIDLVEKAKNLNIPIISALGTGNKLDPLKIEVADIYSTSVCPLAKVMRKELRARNISNLKVIYSKEEPINVLAEKENGRNVPGSTIFVPSVAGIVIAKEVILDLIK